MTGPEKDTEAGSQPSASPGKEAATSEAPDSNVDSMRVSAQAEASAATVGNPPSPTENPQLAQEDAHAPDPRQERLAEVVSLLQTALGLTAVTDSYLSELDSWRPYLIIDAHSWQEAALLLRDHDDLHLDYLRSMAGTDYETHMEVVYYLLSLSTGEEYAVKVKTERNEPSIPSVTPVWATANWNEREIYDLLGIDFPGHPDLRRILMPDDWVGHPLRKDYEPLDPEV
ncbi:NADH-quinone oxidoreductase subunit C [Gorillibacterium timonense]|uniref:NADH-quinone oxidoreductase subunit C n=1 Tax=Gorillibacterium timonense TaxID=1689269 RepID=UPI0009EBE064|nr:NADH-quinone oxidoreductase subunit C [Gorillibacterium timonense]